MIAPERVAEVKRLLAETTLSQRKVSILTGVSRASVGAIAAGRRPDYPPRCKPDDADDGVPHGPAARCPSCGGLVYMPCRLCRVRAIKRREHEGARARGGCEAESHAKLNCTPLHTATAHTPAMGRVCGEQSPCAASETCE